MVEFAESRRKLLMGAGGATAALLTGGIFLAADDGFSPQSSFSSRSYDAVIEGGPTAKSGPAYYATVIASEGASSQMYWDRFDESIRADYRDIDYGDHFISVFISRYPLCDPGKFCGAVSRVTVNEGKLVYLLDREQFQFDDWTYGDSLYLHLNLWRYEGIGVNPPDETAIKLV